MPDFDSKKLSFAEAQRIIKNYDELKDTEFNELVRRWAAFDVPESEYAPMYKEIRSSIVKEFRSTLAENDNRVDYILDLKVGIRLYELLCHEQGFTLIQANDDDIWRYISVCVMPDLTFIRYPNQTSDVDIIREKIEGLSYAISVKTEKDSIRIKRKRFYSHTRRIWLKTLWWYIHLGWQGDSEQTYEVLKNNGTNMISHFIERPGRGYREQLFRSMLYAFSQLPEQQDKVFRAAAKLNLAKCVSVEPALTAGKEPVYSERLFREVYSKEQSERNAEGSNTQ